MEERKFKPGDIVMLKSGGPDMTVQDYKTILIPDGLKTTKSKTDVICVWYENGKMFQETFHQDMIEFVNKYRR